MFRKKARVFRRSAGITDTLPCQSAGAYGEAIEYIKPPIASGTLMLGEEQKYLLPIRQTHQKM